MQTAGSEIVVAAGTGGGTGAPDVTPPALSLTVARTLDLAKTVRSGLAVPATCSEQCNLEAELSLDRATARRLGIAQAKRVVVGRGKAALAAGQKKTVKVKLVAKARRKLARASRVRLQLVLVATDAAGNRTQLKRSVTLQRLRKKSTGRHARAGAAGPVVLLSRGELSVGMLTPAMGSGGATARK